jgi:hypothetical protein
MSEQRFDGRYVLRRGIAHVTSGGAVYAAEHAFTHHTCAIKIFDAQARDVVRRRAEREMEALARVQGPSVVEFRDAGESDGRLFIVMKLLDGRTLDGLLAAKGSLPVADTIEIGARIAGALARCHERGVVHRDVKPHNVHVDPANDVHLLDFGIAKVVDASGTLAKLTMENALMGTPEYMAPEALLASPDVDHRADQYSLGITLYECLTGAVPFEGTYAEVLPKVTTTAITPIRTLRPDTPERFARWLDRVFQHDPEARFPDMAAAARALADLGGERGAATLADSPGARRPATRRRFVRAPYASLARIERVGSTFVDVRVDEISEGGCQVLVDRVLPVGEKLKLRFSTPISGRVVELAADCRWTRSTRVAIAHGFEFSSVPPDVAFEIRKYVALMGDAYAPEPPMARALQAV